MKAAALVALLLAPALVWAQGGSISGNAGGISGNTVPTGGALNPIPTLNVLGNISGGTATPTQVPLDNVTLTASGGALKVNTGTSGSVIPLLSGANIWSGAQHFGAQTVDGSAVAFTGGSLSNITHNGGTVTGSFAGSPIWTGNHTFSGTQMTVGSSTPGTFFINPSTTNNLFIGLNSTTMAQFRVNGIGGSILNVEGSRTGSTTINNSLLLSPGGSTPVAGQHGILASATWTGTNSAYSMNILQADDQITGGGSVLTVSQNIDNVAASGQKTAFGTTVTVNGLSGNGSAYPGGIYVAGVTGAIATVNDGGSTAGFGSSNKGSGNLFGWNPGATLHCTSGNPAVQPCATGYAGLNTLEVDVQTDTGTSTNTRFGAAIGLSDGINTQGVWEDAAFVFGHVQNQASNSGWRQGIMFGIPQAGFPMDPLGTMIGAGPVTGGTMLAAYGMDFSLVTFSGGFLKSAGFLVDGSGNITAPSVGNGASTFQISGAGQWSANGAVATTLTSLGPAGAHTTVQEWLTVVDAAGVTRYIPAY